MGRRKIAIQPITDERNRTVYVSPSYCFIFSLSTFLPFYHVLKQHTPSFSAFTILSLSF
ncbi:uncharacterized protein ASCRUDRAFT_78223 [Ascoidea rubescens DSM 1968]|uniref:Uncharacterized protein n=1 Tax=Ascoidea rubescens DSM 1968 TaxID=1344418 RepID=A0A1D2V9G4_9ASCO|nr:hypothetical protein ASCRUDRAFT_78223 [Ascoidea rubescens DSM 1968]ODV58117.1 hypothetical protein ASCRUDRAFT_78223 [Ascoidea rubescens DSM 1968]